MTDGQVLALLVFSWAITWGLPAAVIASDRGYSGALYLVFGILLGPLAIVHAIVQPRTFSAELRRQEAQGRQRCSNCSEFIYEDAGVCPHCGNDVEHMRRVEDMEESR